MVIFVLRRLSKDEFDENTGILMKNTQALLSELTWSIIEDNHGFDNIQVLVLIMTSCSSLMAECQPLCSAFWVLGFGEGLTRHSYFTTYNLLIKRKKKIEALGMGLCIL